MLRSLLLLIFASVASAAPPSGFRASLHFDELVREQAWPSGVRAIANLSANFDPKKPTRLILYATPNGNTIEQTLGCATTTGLDWHFDIQHVAAQVRQFRFLKPNENIAHVVIEAEGLSWPAWKRKQTDGPARIRTIVDEIRGWIPGESKLILSCHSGGGSFLFGFLDSAEAIPPFVEHIVFLDANYSYSDADQHGDKLLAWLKADATRKLSVIAYDDRKITLSGKLVVGPDGGTYRATDRMHARFAKDATFVEKQDGDVRARTAFDGRLSLLVHANTANIILHTALVGEMNGLLHALDGAPFGGPRAYAKWVQPAPGIPKRPADAVGGAEFIRSIEKFHRSEREEAIAREVLRGNIPEFLRSFRKVETKIKDANGKERTAIVEVMPDYLAIGNNADFVRMPMNPLTAARIADAFGCALPTRKLVDDIYRTATVKLAPKPLTMNRESPATFLQHNAIIEEQRSGSDLGKLVAGHKKDVVVTNRLAEKPNRVAIYGWHQLDGQPIQPLTIVHVDWYVDYSHGVRLMKRAVTVDGKTQDVRQVLLSPSLSPLSSDEGPVLRPTY
jgi:hypothetical protein